MKTTATKTTKPKTPAITRGAIPKGSSPKVGKKKSESKAAASKPNAVPPMRSFSDPNRSVGEIAAGKDGKPDPKKLAESAQKSTGVKPVKGSKSKAISSKNLAPELRKELVEYKQRPFDECSATFTKHCRMLPGGVGLQISDKITIPETADVLSFLMGMNQTLQFSIGDVLVFADVKFGELASQICLATGYSYDTLCNAQWVCSRIPQNRRMPLSFSHHKAVAALTDKQQDKFLTEAISEKISSRDLEKKVKAFKEQQDGKKAGAATPPQTPPNGQTPAAGAGTPPEPTKPQGEATGSEAGASIQRGATPTEPRDTASEANDKAQEAADIVISFLRSPIFKVLRPLQRKAWETIGRQINELAQAK